jgi:hypothetical protein
MQNRLQDHGTHLQDHGTHLQGHETCTAWMQTLLRGSSAPVSQQGELEWGELLTNRYKMQLYLQQLQQ